uniref:EF-hand domain-containing protein n=1 Tax=Periophthalmus magnuspinnatus TaxID=409849 RepID=A0A3B3ZKZ0_9GOBI
SNILDLDPFTLYLVTQRDLKSGGFSVDACRSMVALMDTSITGKLNSEEFVGLWGKITTFKDIFFRTDVSRTGTLSMSELRNAIAAIGNLSIVVKFRSSSGHMSLENFISLVLRYECMSSKYNHVTQ